MKKILIIAGLLALYIFALVGCGNLLNPITVDYEITAPDEIVSGTYNFLNMAGSCYEHGDDGGTLAAASIQWQWVGTPDDSNQPEIIKIYGNRRVAFLPENAGIYKIKADIECNSSRWGNSKSKTIETSFEVIEKDLAIISTEIISQSEGESIAEESDLTQQTLYNGHSAVIIDLNGDDVLEMIVLDQGDIYVVGEDGDVVSSYGNFITDDPAYFIGNKDMDSDGLDEIILGIGTKYFVYRQP